MPLFNRPHEPMKLCKDCFWYIQDIKPGYSMSADPMGRICTHPKNTAISLVTGEPYYSESPGPLRVGFRSSAGACGLRGKWWEARIEKGTFTDTGGNLWWTPDK